MAFSMKDKNVVITGGNKGIGAGITEVFLKEGANVVFTGRNEEGEIKWIFIFFTDGLICFTIVLLGV